MYLILKVTEEQILNCGSIFEAARGHWVLDPNNARKCENVVVVTNKKIKEVFNVDEWYPSTLCEDRYVFAGVPNRDLTKRLIGKEINPDLCLKGAENPVRYVDENELLADE